MSVITLQVVYLEDSLSSRYSVSALKKRKFIASPSIFTISDIFYSQVPRSLDVTTSLPEAVKVMEEYEEISGKSGPEIWDRIRELERSYPFVNLDKERDWKKIFQHYYPDLKILDVQSPHHSTTLLQKQLFWPTITIKSLDQTQETMYFFSMEEAEAALNLILEGINNG